MSASGRTFTLRPVTSTDPKTGVVSITNLVELPEELVASWHSLNIANVYRSQADQLLDLIRTQLKTMLPAEHGLPVRHLYSHAIELYLKAFLRAEGVTEDEIRDMGSGHGLEDLYAECNSLGLAMSSAEATFFDSMLQYHLKGGHEEYQFRYFEKSFQTADPDLIRAAGHVIARVAGAHIDNLLREFREQAEKAGKLVLSLPKKMLISVGAGSTPDGKVPVIIGLGSPPPSA